VRRRLPRPDKRLVLLIESVNLGIQFIEVLKCSGETLGVLSFYAPREYTAQAGQALPKRE
jgi:hypothetical protein